jgi:hypothetical protein
MSVPSHTDTVAASVNEDRLAIAVFDLAGTGLSEAIEGGNVDHPPRAVAGHGDFDTKF